LSEPTLIYQRVSRGALITSLADARGMHLRDSPQRGSLDECRV
jgi:hypothetical protein